jgi:hypothetical protein
MYPIRFDPLPGLLDIDECLEFIGTRSKRMHDGIISKSICARSRTRFFLREKKSLRDDRITIRRRIARTTQTPWGDEIEREGVGEEKSCSIEVETK